MRGPTRPTVRARARRSSLPLLACVAALALGAVAAWSARRGAPAATPPAQQAPTAGDTSSARDASEPGPASGAPAATGGLAPSATERDSALEPAPPGGRAAAPLGVLALALTREDATPIAGAKVLLHRAGSILAKRTTDAGGQAMFDAVAGEVGVAVSARNHAIFLGTLDGSAGARTLALPDGFVLRGRVLVDGAPPGAPVALALHASWGPYGRRPAVPTEVRREFQPTLRTGAAAQVVTAPDGELVVRGLPDNCWGWLECGTGFAADPWVLDRRRTAEGPLTAGMTVELARVLVVRGRVAWETGDPVLGRVRAELAGERAFTAMLERGQFEIRMPPRPGAELLLHVKPRAGRGERPALRFLAPAAVDGAWDLGALTLQGLRRLEIEVRDRAGAPVPHVSASAGPGQGAPQSSRYHAPTGVLRVSVPDDVPELLLRASGYEDATLAIPADRDALAVTLTAISRLELTVAGVQAPSDDLVIAVVHAPASDAGPAGDPGSSPGGPPAERLRTLDWRGRWTVDRLPAGVPLRVELRTSLSRVALGDGRTLAAYHVAPLAAGEQRRLTLTPALAARRLEMLVTLEDGSPAPSARVRVRGRTDSKRLDADAQGRVALEPLYGELVDLEIAHPGRETVHLSDQRLDELPPAVRVGPPR